MTTKIQTAFTGTWQPNNVESFSAKLQKFNPSLTVLRAWQEECATSLINSGKNNRMVVAPTGSGKSIAINYLISHMLHNNMAKKLIVSVPQKAIGGGFTNNAMVFPMDEEGKETFSFIVKHDYCSDSVPVDSKTDAVIEFLEDEFVMTGSDRILVCVNNTLVNVFNKLKETDKLHLLNDVAFWFDEAHHIQTENDEVANGLGGLVLHCLQNNISINAVTATAFRGDRLSIIPSQYADSFAKFSLPYDRHFSEHCNGMGFAYEFVLHTEDWYDGFKKILADHGDEGKKTIMFIPHPNTKAFKSTSSCKLQCVDDVLKIIKDSELTQEEDKEDQNGVTTFDRNGRTIRVVDLVSDENRSTKVEFLRSKEGEIVDYVIGINVPKEGFDWPCANREFIIGPKNSLNELMQMMGRTFRGHPTKDADKDNVEIFHLLTMIDSSKAEQSEIREALNSYLKAVYMSMIGENIMNPPTDIKIPTRKVKDGEDEIEFEVEPNEALEYAVNALGGESQWADFMEDCLEQCRIVRTENEDEDGKLLNIAEMNDKIRETIINFILDDERIEQYHDEIEHLIFSAMVRRSVNISNQFTDVLAGFNVDDVDFDILEEIDSMQFMLHYSNGVCNADTFKKLRESIGERWYASLEQHVEWFTVEKCSYVKWKDGLYKKYINEGAARWPAQFYKVPSSHLTGFVVKEYRTLEEHKELFRQLQITKFADWPKKHFNKYKEQGYCKDPDRKFGCSQRSLIGREDYKNKEEHVELFQKLNGPSRKEWQDIYYAQYESFGYRYDPSQDFGCSWYDLCPERKTEYKSLEEHIELFKKYSYTQKTYLENLKNNTGYFRNPNEVFKKPWSYFTGNRAIAPRL